MSFRKIHPIDNGWSFRQANDPSSQFLPVSQFPTNVHLDLLHHDLIPDPNIGKNEKAVQWVGEKSWIYKTNFSTPTLSTAKAVLAFDGLDTYATVRLNGVKILEIEDMFIPERIEVTDILSSHEPNVLEIVFDSTYLIGKKLVEKYPDHYWGCWNGDPSRLAVRKAQYHYGWDWGPALLTCGPWRPISLEVYTARISDLSFSTEVCKSLKTAEIVATVEVEGDVDEVVFDIAYDGERVAQEIVVVDNGVAVTTLRTQNAKLWYPHTYGEQPLYLLTARLLLKKTLLDVSHKRFGLRRCEVVQHKLENASGTSFYFEINNIAIFCGGSNWIPADNFIPRITAQKYHDWVKMAVESNQVMLRVWGGGVYEEQAFYDACDEMGVLVWQDFLFACGNYPAHDEFLDLVKREATANIKLLRHHPSIVLWAGNNEDYQYRETENLDYDPHDRDPESWLRSTFPARYIYEKVLVDVTSSLIPKTYYHFGSPYGGKTTADSTVGDIHQWNVWHGTQQPYQKFASLSGRFITEFGMQGLPSIETIDSFLPHGKDDQERYALSSTLDFHNKADGHARRLAMYMDENIRYTFEPLEQYIYCTQLMQAECVGTAYRSWKRNWKGPNREECAGVLVWQLNDCWPGTSWAIADCDLRPKLAYHAVQRELQPITIGLQRIVETIPADKYTRAYIRTVCKIEMWAVNLSLETHDVEVTIHSHNLITNKRITITNQPKHVKLLPNRSTEIDVFEIPVSVKDSEEANQTVVAAYLHDKSGKQLARAVNWPEPLKWVHMPKPERIGIRLAGDRSEGEGKPSAIILSADVCIKGLQLEVKDREGGERVVFEDNGIDLVAGEEVRVGTHGLGRDDEGRLGVRYLDMKSC